MTILGTKGVFPSHQQSIEREPVSLLDIHEATKHSRDFRQVVPIYLPSEDDEQVILGRATIIGNTVTITLREDLPGVELFRRGGILSLNLWPEIIWPSNKSRKKGAHE